jgi:hypothetical protein
VAAANWIRIRPASITGRRTPDPEDGYEREIASGMPTHSEDHFPNQSVTGIAGE